MAAAFQPPSVLPAATWLPWKILSSFRAPGFCPAEPETCRRAFAVALSSLPLGRPASISVRAKSIPAHPRQAALVQAELADCAAATGCRSLALPGRPCPVRPARAFRTIPLLFAAATLSWLRTTLEERFSFLELDRSSNQDRHSALLRRTRPIVGTFQRPVNPSRFARCTKMCSPCYSRGYNFPVAHCDRADGAPLVCKPRRQQGDGLE